MYFKVAMSLHKYICCFPHIHKLIDTFSIYPVFLLYLPLHISTWSNALMHSLIKAPLITERRKGSKAIELKANALCVLMLWSFQKISNTTLIKRGLSFNTTTLILLPVPLLYFAHAALAALNNFLWWIVWLSFVEAKRWWSNNTPTLWTGWRDRRLRVRVCL